MSALLLVLLIAAAKPEQAAKPLLVAQPAKAAKAAKVVKPADAETSSLTQVVQPAAASSAESKCEKCHTTSSWAQVTFHHEITGFPLRGGHQKVGCVACHEGGFEQKLQTTCASCHRDAHAGELGLRCEGCHDEVTWKGAFNADAHRRTNFPLEGRHAVIPCEECHIDARERRFTRAALGCGACHARDVARAALTSIDHDAAGFGDDCQRCHLPTRFDRARFAQHDGCFLILRGAHRGIACLDCHVSLMGAAPNGSCTTNTAACSGCHEHACDRTDGQHQGVPGYECKDRKCYECHRTVE